MVTIKLTKNEKKTLKLLLRDGRASDTDIADQLKITKQAVGKIRRKLEESGVILKYSANVDYTKLGVTVFATETLTINSRCGKESFNCCEPLLKNPHVLQTCKLPEQNRYVMYYGFRDLNELESFFKANHSGDFLGGHGSCVEHSQLKIFPGSCMLKDSDLDLLYKVIDEF